MHAPRGLVNVIVGSPLCPKRVRRVVLWAWGVDVHTSGIQERCFFGGRDIHIGARARVNVGCTFDNSAHISIGEHTGLGMEVLIITSTHQLEGAAGRGGEVVSAPVTIGKGCWIGSRVTFMPGSEVGDGCIVGAGSLVEGKLAPDGLYVGTPVRRLRNLEPIASVAA